MQDVVEKAYEQVVAPNPGGGGLHL